MRKNGPRFTSQTSNQWQPAGAGRLPEEKQDEVVRSPLGEEWLPESALRDALIADRLPTVLGGANLFWVNVREYLSHGDAQLPAEQYLLHWREIYRSCLNQETERLRNISYVRLGEPGRGSDWN